MNWSALKAWLLALPREARGAVVGLAAIMATILLVLAANIWSSASASWSEIAKNEPRIARLKGYQAFQPAIEEAASEAKVILSELAFTASSDESQTGAQLQQLLRGFAEEAGLTVRGSQLISGVEEEETPEGFVQLRVDLRMRGLPVALSLFLRDVYDHSPRLKVSEMDVIKVRDRRSTRRRDQPQTPVEQDLDLSVQVTALMVST
jgi:hypothetical protein